MINSMRMCVTHNDLLPWPKIWRSFSHCFATKLLNYVTSCRVRSTAHTVLDCFFPYLAYMITGVRGCVLCNDLWPWPVSSRSFSHNFAIKLLKYGTSSFVCFTACTILDGFFPYFAQMITSIRGCVMHNELWSILVDHRSSFSSFVCNASIYVKMNTENT